jgi:hypothetical protein
MAYVVTRPLGASFADWISKPSNMTGLGFGDGPTALVFALAVLALVSYLAIARPDIQRSAGPAGAHTQSMDPSPERLASTPQAEFE